MTTNKRNMMIGVNAFKSLLFINNSLTLFFVIILLIIASVKPISLIQWKLCPASKSKEAPIAPLFYPSVCTGTTGLGLSVYTRPISFVTVSVSTMIHSATFVASTSAMS